MKTIVWINKLLAKASKPITQTVLYSGDSGWLDKLLEEGEADGGHESMDAFPSR